MSASGKVAEFRSQLGAVATDPAFDPSQRIRELRRVRDRVSEAMESEPTNAARAELRSLVGQADTYIGDNQLRREARSLRHALGRIELREDAELREEMVEDGFDADALDAAGFFAHEQIDAMEEDGTLPEVIGGR